MSWLFHLTLFVIMPAALALCIKAYDMTRGPQ